jgi:hypothetical protein
LEINHYTVCKGKIDVIYIFWIPGSIKNAVGTLKVTSNTVWLLYSKCIKYGKAKLLDYFQVAAECSGYTHHLKSIEFQGHFSYYKGRDNQRGYSFLCQCGQYFWSLYKGNYKATRKLHLKIHFTTGNMSIFITEELFSTYL